jgi:hypothetical protein
MSDDDYDKVLNEQFDEQQHSNKDFHAARDALSDFYEYKTPDGRLAQVRNCNNWCSIYVKYVHGRPTLAQSGMKCHRCITGPGTCVEQIVLGAGQLSILKNPWWAAPCQNQITIDEAQERFAAIVSGSSNIDSLALAELEKALKRCEACDFAHTTGYNSCGHMKWTLENTQ